jgi:hypothetical protein
MSRRDVCFGSVAASQQFITWAAAFERLADIQNES